MSNTPAKITAKRTIKNNVDVATSIIDVGQKIFNATKEQYHKHFTYTITISEKDPFYGEVLDWLTVLSPDEKHRALSVSSSRNPKGYSDDVSPNDSRSVATSKLTVRFDEGSSKTLRINGHSVQVQVIVPESKEKDSIMGNYEHSKVRFTTKSYTAQQAVLEMLNELNAQKGLARKAVLKMVSTWGSWTTRSDLPPRSIESVSLPQEQKKRIANDLKKFLESEDKYNRLAIPWHRGYMLYGPPGTGKTSLVKALANEFNLDLWYISLSDLKAEASLINLMSEVGPRSILLLEDIDTIQITHDRDNSEQGKISLSSLLNSLDGVATPHGLVAFMTTNRFEVLDDALTRAGRMDLIEELSWPTANTLSTMYAHFYNKKPAFWRRIWFDIPLVGLSTAEVAEIFKRNMDDPRNANQEVISRITKILN